MEIVLNKIKAQAEIIFVFEDKINFDYLDELKEQKDNIDHFLKSTNFKPKKKSVACWVPPAEYGCNIVLFIGLGKSADLNYDTIREGMANGISNLKKYNVQSAVFFLPDKVFENNKEAENYLTAAVEGLYLGSYSFDKYKTDKDKLNEKYPEKIQIGPDKFLNNPKLGVVLQNATLVAKAVNFCRDLVNEPASVITPTALANIAREIAKNGKGIKCEIYDKEEIKKIGLNGLLSVSQGSKEPPVFIKLTYTPRGEIKKRIALVGKGITFDSGGLGIKPADSMYNMKDDMAGVAALLSVAKLLSEFEDSVHCQVNFYLPCTENMPGGGAYKPGDIFKAYNGKSVEVSHTDAEGRLILADALSFACSEKPDEIIDVATLTGAAAIALGPSISAVIGNNQALIDRIISAANLAGESMWQLPLEMRYKEILKSSVADIKNSNLSNRAAGTIVGGLFLHEFVGNTPWVHVDIASTAFSEKDDFYFTSGATGVSVRTIFNYIKSI